MIIEWNSKHFDHISSGTDKKNCAEWQFTCNGKLAMYVIDWQECWPVDNVDMTVIYVSDKEPSTKSGHLFNTLKYTFF